MYTILFILFLRSGHGVAATSQQIGSYDLATCTQLVKQMNYKTVEDVNGYRVYTSATAQCVQVKDK